MKRHRRLAGAASPGRAHQRAGGAKNEQANSGNELSAGRDQRQLDLPLASIGLAVSLGAPEGYGQNGRSTDHRGLHRLQFRAALTLWPFLPERDRCEHSQNSAHRSITPPCQNRGPAKDELETLRIRPRAGGQRRRRQQLGDRTPGVGRLRTGLRGRGERGFLEPAVAESPEGCPPAARLREGGGAGPLGPVADRGAGPAGLAEGEPGRGYQPTGVHRPRQCHGGRCCTAPSSSRRWSATWPRREHWRGWSG